MSNRFIAATLACLSLSLSAGSAFAACTIGKFADLPVTMTGRTPLVTAKINGTEVQFIAGSGAFFSSITPATAQELKLPHQGAPAGFTVQGTGGEAGVWLTTVRTFTLDKVPVSNVEFMVTGGVTGDVAGVLGQNVLGLADVEYDLANGVIRLVKPHDCARLPLAYWARGAGYSVMDIKRPEPADPHTIGEAFLNGVKIKVVFDSGTATSVMTLAAAARVGIKPDSPGVVQAGLSTGLGRRVAKNWIAPFTSFKIGDEEIRNTKLRVADIELSYADFIIGADFFLSHRIYVSNDQKKLYFTYNGGPVFNLTTAPPPVQVADQSSAAPPASKPEEEPQDADGFSRRGAALAARRDYEPAIADFTRAIAMAPTEPKYYYERAVARAANRQPFLAMSDLDETLKLTPNDLQALMMRAGLRINGRDIPGAASDLENAGRVMPKESDLRLGLGNLYERAELNDQAIAQFDQWIAAHSEDGRLAQALNGRCWIRAITNRELDKALNDCNRAVRASPKNANLLDSRGLVHLRMGDNDKAIADYDAALALNPKIAWSLYGRGLAKQRKGMNAEGQADMTAGAALQANLPAEAKRYRIDPPS